MNRVGTTVFVMCGKESSSVRLVEIVRQKTSGRDIHVVIENGRRPENLPALQDIESRAEVRFYYQTRRTPLSDVLNWTLARLEAQRVPGGFSRVLRRNRRKISSLDGILWPTANRQELAKTAAAVQTNATGGLSVFYLDETSVLTSLRLSRLLHAVRVASASTLADPLIQ